MANRRGMNTGGGADQQAIKAMQDLADGISGLRAAFSSLPDQIAHAVVDWKGASDTGSRSADAPTKQAPRPGQLNPDASSPKGNWLTRNAENNSYALGNDFNMLEANLRSGIIGEPTFQSALQYGSYFAGLKPRRQYEAGLQSFAEANDTTVQQLTEAQREGVHQSLMKGDGRYAAQMGTSVIAGKTAMGISYAQNASHFVESMSNLGAGRPGASDPYLQVEGRGGSGMIGGTIFSGANRERWADKFKSRWRGLSNYNWSSEEEKSLQLAFRNIGVDPDGDRIKDVYSGIRDLKTSHGLDPQMITDSMRLQIRTGSKEEVQKQVKNWDDFANAVKKSGMNAQAAAEGVIKFSEAMRGQMGMSKVVTAQIAQKFTADTELDAGVLQSMMSSPMGQANMLAEGFKLDPTHPFRSIMRGDATAGMQQRGLDQMLTMMGADSISDLSNPDVENMFGMLSMFGGTEQFGLSGDPSEMQGLLADRFGVSMKEMNKLTKGSVWNPEQKSVGGDTQKVEIEFTGEAKKWVRKARQPEVTRRLPGYVANRWGS